MRVDMHLQGAFQCGAFTSPKLLEASYASGDGGVGPEAAAALSPANSLLALQVSLLPPCKMLSGSQTGRSKCILHACVCKVGWCAKQMPDRSECRDKVVNNSIEVYKTTASSPFAQ